MEYNELTLQNYQQSVLFFPTIFDKVRNADLFYIRTTENGNKNQTLFGFSC